MSEKILKKMKIELAKERNNQANADIDYGVTLESKLEFMINNFEKFKVGSCGIKDKKFCTFVYKNIMVGVQTNLCPTADTICVKISNIKGTDTLINDMPEENVVLTREFSRSCLEGYCDCDISYEFAQLFYTKTLLELEKEIIKKTKRDIDELNFLTEDLLAEEQTPKTGDVKIEKRQKKEKKCSQA